MGIWFDMSAGPDRGPAPRAKEALDVHTPHQGLRTTTLTAPAGQLRQALRTACAPLYGVGARAQKQGRIWVGISDGGQLRFTTQWHRQWARTYVRPLTLQTPPEAPTPRPPRPPPPPCPAGRSRTWWVLAGSS